MGKSFWLSTHPFLKSAARGLSETYRFLLMGVVSTASMPQKVIFHYYEWKKNLGKHLSVSQAMIACGSPFKFIKQVFESTISSATYPNLHVRFLNQISGRVFPSGATSSPKHL